MSARSAFAPPVGARGAVGVLEAAFACAPFLTPAQQTLANDGRFRSGIGALPDP